MIVPIFFIFCRFGPKKEQNLDQKGGQKPGKNRVFQENPGRVKPGLKTENPGFQPGLDDP